MILNKLIRLEISIVLSNLILKNINLLYHTKLFNLNTFIIISQRFYKVCSQSNPEYAIYSQYLMMFPILFPFFSFQIIDFPHENRIYKTIKSSILLSLAIN